MAQDSLNEEDNRRTEPLSQEALAKAEAQMQAALDAGNDDEALKILSYILEHEQQDVNDGAIPITQPEESTLY